MQQTYFEATPAQKKIADIGRAMMDFSENYGKENGLGTVTDNGLRTLNELSAVGYMLTQVGAVFGTSLKDLSKDDQKLISDFIQDSVDIEHK